MVTVVRRDKPENPNRQSRTFTNPQDMNIPPADGPGRFQRGVDMISNYFSNLGDKRANLAAAAGTEKDKGTSFLNNQYYMDYPRFIANQAAGAGEFFHDVFQLPFESGAQILGYDRGSGQGSGDIGYGLSQLFNFDNARDKKEMAISDIYSNIPDLTNFETLVEDSRFQDFLRGQGFNVSDDFNFFKNIMDYGSQTSQQQFLDDIAMDENNPFFVGEAPDIYDFDASGGMDPYNEAVKAYQNKLYDTYDQYMRQEASNLLNETLIPSYVDTQMPIMTNQLMDQLGITEKTAEGILTGTGEMDYGLANDLMDFYYPYEYQTKEGQEFFGDPGVDLTGSLLGFSGVGGLLRSGKRKLGSGKAAAVLEQLYPMTFAGSKAFTGGLSLPIKFGREGARMNLGVLQNYPKTAAAIRGPGQAYLTMAGPDFLGSE